MIFLERTTCYVTRGVDRYKEIDVELREHLKRGPRPFIGIASIKTAYPESDKVVWLIKVYYEQEIESGKELPDGFKWVELPNVVRNNPTHFGFTQVQQ